MKCIGYLSAAPRVSTRPDAEASGPRSHVLGVINGFRNSGWHVRSFIVGDRMAVKVLKKNTESMLSKSKLHALLADVVRFGMGVVNARRALGELDDEVHWVYERFAALQSLGWIFKRKGIPWILETNAPLFYEAKVERKSLVLTKLARKLEISAYHKCDVLICVTEELKNIIIRETGIDPGKVIVVPNGVDVLVYDPQKYRAKRLFAEFTVGFVGSVISWQGLNLLLTAIKELQEEGVFIRAVIVGDGPARGEWQQLAEELGLSEYTKFVGRVPATEVPEYISGFDICYSGQLPLKIGVMYLSPLKLYEYMAMAKPVIASNFADAGKLVKNGVTGYLFEPGNLEALMSCLREAYAAGGNLVEMGRAAREQIVQEHSWESRVRMMIPQIEEILGRKV
ncbi:glycosyltransferase family 4 protein [Brevibacillus sp. B_LB10_24]|uniref:glycosyltransferase family 4 protein n=1 Tax=Brevibacillus sp. B_LB10_24 TaxID=3380645 RepID=UPI0038BB3301